MSPFRGIFTPIDLGVTGGDVPAVFETSVMFAMIVYGIVALLFSVLIGWLSGRLDQIENAETELQRREEYQARVDAVAAQQAARAAGQTVAPTGTVSAPPPGAVPGAAPGTTQGVQASPPHDL